MQHIIAICTFGDTNESSTRDDAKNTAKDEAKDKSKEALSAKLPSNRCQAEDGKGAKKVLWVMQQFTSSRLRHFSDP